MRRKNSNFNVPKEKMTALQRHVAFFDLNNDGLITCRETFSAFRKLGFNIFLCILAPFLFNLPLAWWTSDSWWPTLTIRIKNIHKVKHGSDSQVYDHNGNFNEERFEAMWATFDTDGDGYLSFWDLLRMTEQFKRCYDIFGWIASKVLWGLLYLLIQERGRVAKEFVKGQYDGTLFEKIEEVKNKRLHQQLEKKNQKGKAAH